MKLVVTAPRISGVRTTPDDVAEVPITPWTNSRTKLIGPNHADRQVDVEDPAPARVVHDEPTDERADNRGAGEDRADQPLVAPAVAGRDDHPDHREGQREDAAGPDALDGAEDDQFPQVLRRTA